MKNNTTIQQFNNLYVFVLGRETKIARLELESVLRHFGFCFYPEHNRGVDILSVVDNVAIIKFEERIRNNELGIMDKQSENHNSPFKIHNSMQSLMALLGGTIKVFQIVGKGSNNLINDIAKIVQDNSVDMVGKLNLGISDYRPNPTTTNNINQIGLSIKKILKKSHNTRFVALKEGFELSSVVSYKNKLDSKGFEIGIFNNCHSERSEESQSEKGEILRRQTPQDDRILLGKLVAVTNPEEWSKRDYDKPRGDKYSGMTPPKLARMLLNITFSQANHKSQAPNHKQISNHQNPNIRNSELEIRNYHGCVVLDPFCGSGNILMEAAMLGCDVIGSDVSEKAVDDTKANLEWLQQNFQFSIFNFQSNSNDKISKSNQIFQADATTFDFSALLQPNSYNLTPIIVTEPYLGQPKKFAPSMNAARGEYQKVKELYLDFLKNLQPNSYNLRAICVIFPLVETVENKQYSLFSECVDEIKEMGYTLICNPMIYGREYQVVKREIVLLKSNSMETR